MNGFVAEQRYTAFRKRGFNIIILNVMLCIIGSVNAQSKRALLIGISDYPTYPNSKQSWAQIHGANDVELLKPLLISQKFSVMSLTNSSATASAIRKKLSRLANDAEPGDMIYIHFSMHGQAVEDENGDEEDGWDESLVPYDAQRNYLKGQYEGEQHILDDEIQVHIDAIRKKVGEKRCMYVIIDACHAGTSYRGEEEDSTFTRGTTSGFSKRGTLYLPRIDKRNSFNIPNKIGLSNLIMVEACRSYETNTEIIQEGKYYGSLSYYIYAYLLTSPLTSDIKWVEEVRRNMDRDSRLIKQHLVIEQSE